MLFHKSIRFCRSLEGLGQGYTGYFIGYSPKVTRLLVTFQAPDTVIVVCVFIELHAHGTIAIACPAQGAFVGIMGHSKHTDFIKERVDGPERAGDPAKGSAAYYHPCEK